MIKITLAFHFKCCVKHSKMIHMWFIYIISKMLTYFSCLHFNFSLGNILGRTSVSVNNKSCCCWYRVPSDYHYATHCTNIQLETVPAQTRLQSKKKRWTNGGWKEMLPSLIYRLEDCSGTALLFQFHGEVWVFLSPLEGLRFAKPQHLSASLHPSHAQYTQTLPV